MKDAVYAISLMEETDFSKRMFEDPSEEVLKSFQAGNSEIKVH